MSDEQAEIEARRFEIRKRLERQRGILCGIAGGLLVAFGGVMGDILKPRSFMDYVVHLAIAAAAIAVSWYLVASWLRYQENRMLREESK